MLLAFLRITTRVGVFERPLRVERALGYVDSWLDQPFVRPVVPGARHWAIVKSLLKDSCTAGNLTSDAHLAALALEQRCPIYSTDTEFNRFPGVGHHNPLASDRQGPDAEI